MMNSFPRCSHCQRLLLASRLIVRTGECRLKQHRGTSQATSLFEWRCRRCGHVWWSAYQLPMAPRWLGGLHG